MLHSVGNMSENNQAHVSGMLMDFCSKIEEAISLVQSMTTEDKLQAVQYWNAVSENLQDIVNSSADDISALASQLSDRDSLIMRLYGGYLPHQRAAAVAGFSGGGGVFSVGAERCAAVQLGREPSLSDQLDQPASLFTLEPESSDKQTAAVDTPLTPDMLDRYLAPPAGSEHGQQPAPSIGSVMSDHCAELLEQTAVSPSEAAAAAAAAAESLDTVDPETLAGAEVPPADFADGQPMQVEATLASCAVDQPDDLNDPLPLPELHWSEARADDLDLEEPVTAAACSQQQESSVLVTSQSETGRTSGDARSAASSLDGLSRYLTVGKDKRGETVVNFFTKQPKGDSTKRPMYVFVCNVCDRQFSSQRAFYVHFAVHSTKKVFSCSECALPFKSSAHLTAHMRTHNKSRPNQCKECGRCFTVRSNLTRHMLSHADTRPFQCDTCQKRFREKKSLRIHQRGHSGERPYSCTICSARFIQLGSLNAHLEAHADIRRHLCDICGKSFRQKGQLKLHKQRHEGKKGYPCDVCSVAFNVENDLRRHKRIHLDAEQKPYKCDVCGKAFPRQHALTEHLNRHYGNRPYQCPVCSQAFVDLSACHKHIKSHRSRGSCEENGGVMDSSGSGGNSSGADSILPHPLHPQSSAAQEQEPFQGTTVF